MARVAREEEGEAAPPPASGAPVVVDTSGD
jgi:hypothetical protein